MATHMHSNNFNHSACPPNAWVCVMHENAKRGCCVMCVMSAAQQTGINPLVAHVWTAALVRADSNCCVCSDVLAAMAVAPGQAAAGAIGASTNNPFQSSAPSKWMTTMMLKKHGFIFVTSLSLIVFSPTFVEAITKSQHVSLVI
ncbi:hypothetical protein HaLaN_26276 [Haematococcus lacustris]|uniref:Uncharacterized protein n=1 Tax=Haematococcus lacustris TaxID=44745 RepID=A0A6A0A601_HAELA|nr:hypothetical protein HaLaN_26276 [Haematococcus lacustris]